MVLPYMALTYMAMTRFGQKPDKIVSKKNSFEDIPWVSLSFRTDLDRSQSSQNGSLGIFFGEKWPHIFFDSYIFLIDAPIEFHLSSSPE